MGCYSFGGPSGPVCLDIRGVPGPVGLTGDGGLYRLLGDNFSRITKNTVYLLLLCSTLIVLHWKLGICHHLQRW